MTDQFTTFDSTSDHSKPSGNINKPPEHLSEFYSFVNPPPPSASSSSQAVKYDDPDSTLRKNIGRKPSLTTVNTFSSFAPSALDLPTLVTSSDVKVTVKSYQNLVKTASNYREALLLVSNAASEFGQALEQSARCKGSGSAADGLLSAGGLHYLVANHQQILAESISKSFEQPVSKEIELFENKYFENDKQFKSSIKDKTKSLKKNEMENIKLSKMKTRNLQRYRNNLLTLTSQIDEIDRLKRDYYLSTFDIVQDSSMKILSRAGSVVRAQVEIYEGIARKGWSGGGLDDLIAQCPDPFNDDEDLDSDEHDETKDIISGLHNHLIYNSNNNNLSANVSPISAINKSILNFNNSNGTIKLSGENDQASTPPRFNDSVDSSTPIQAYDDISGDESFSLPVAQQIIRSNDEKKESDDDDGTRTFAGGVENDFEDDSKDADIEDDNATVRIDTISTSSKKSTGENGG